ncbi:MAG: ribonuclease R [Neisseriaceae bacterium]|nr:MAG: ribonuclease R [Neisseriaceae bacterium]
MSVSKKQSIRLSDPNLSRERKKYRNPIPSREWILQVLNNQQAPVCYDDLVALLDIMPTEDTAFRHRMKAMVRDGQLYINHHNIICVTDKTQLVKCRVQGHKDGYGFAIPMDDIGKPDFFLSEKQMRSLMHGDVVTVRATFYDKRGRIEATVVEILERKTKELVVRLYVEGGMFIAVPEDKRITHKILLPNENVSAIMSGEVAVIEIDSYPNGVILATGHVKEILGGYDEPGMEIEIAVRKYDLPHTFSDKTLTEVASIPSFVIKEQVENRRDIRSFPLVTIDGESARDFDDAVYAEKNHQGYRLVVAIADVSHYVRPNTAMDQDAYKRGTSVYFPRRVIPMLPEALSNGICSLVPNQDRLCMVCDMKISSSGVICGYEFYPAIMRSHARLTYTEVWYHLSSGGNYPFKVELETLYEVYHVLEKQRIQRGAIDFDSSQTQMIFDENNKIKQIIPEVRNDAHKIIEECMLAANVSAADFILKNKSQSLFRVHEGSTKEKLQILKAQLSLLGLSLNNYDDPKPIDYAMLMSQLDNREDKDLIQTMLLRSMQQAVYQPDNIGHFGLAYDAYTHFTSPIRRYPDLCVHRSIKGILKQEVYQPKSWVEIGVHCSYTERRAEDASRDVEKWLKTYYMRDKIGEIYEGTINGLTNFAVFVTLKAFHVEGMIHISDLGQDYFNYIPEQLSIVGERTKIRFTMGDNVIVKVAQADLDTCRIDLVLVSGGRKKDVNEELLSMNKQNHKNKKKSSRHKHKRKKNKSK